MFPFRDNIPSRTVPLVTYAIIAVNVLVALIFSGMNELEDLEFTFRRGFVPARLTRIQSGEPLEIAKEFVVRDDRGDEHLVKWDISLPAAPLEIVASLFFSMFLHGGLAHLAGNMWFLWLFGDNVEDRLGHVGYLLFYLAGGLVAVACHWFSDRQSMVPVVGASGAVAAVLGAYAVTWPHARIQTLLVLFVFIQVIELPAALFLGGWFLLQLYQGLQPDHFEMHGGVAWWAHIGGFAAGAIAMLVFDRSRHHRHIIGADDDPPPRWGNDEV